MMGIRCAIGYGVALSGYPTAPLRTSIRWLLGMTNIAKLIEPGLRDKSYPSMRSLKSVERRGGLWWSNQMIFRRAMTCPKIIKPQSSRRKDLQERKSKQLKTRSTKGKVGVRKEETRNQGAGNDALHWSAECCRSPCYGNEGQGGRRKGWCGSANRD